ncbi:Protein nud1 [Recurvomyces mirabilis]|nr:Protein nud1 [Recurvomyces mirabilis]
MTTKVAPWLQGLDEVWEVPAGVQMPSSVSSASHDASSLRSNSSRAPRRSLSGLPSSIASQKTSSQATTQLKRSPLAPLTGSNINSTRRRDVSTRLAGTRSVSEVSDGSMIDCGTVQLRSKSASPAKKQETLEWKKRLVAGQVGYGDQTDLFGPSALENIFAKSKGPENEDPKPRKRMSWLQKGDAHMPSSPPPWPKHYSANGGSEQLEALQDDEQQLYDGNEDISGQGSYRSNPFDLQGSSDLQQEDDDSIIQQQADAPAVSNRTISGQTELEQEDFSPVYISKHTTINGQINYAALDSHTIKQFQSMNINLRHPSQNEDNTPEHDIDAGRTEASTFTDGPGSEALPTGPDFSLSENLPTGTPPVASLNGNIEFKRGGYSGYGSFNQRPLSPSPCKVEDSAIPEESELLSPSAAYSRYLPAAPTPPAAMATPLRPTTPNPPKSRSSGSPLKLFGPHDTFTSNRLLRRMSQLDPDGNPVKDELPNTAEESLPPSSKREVSIASSHQSFGSGLLDQHAFNAEITVTSASDSDRSPGSDIPVPGGRDPLNFRQETSPIVSSTFKMKRKLSKHSTAGSKASTIEARPKSPARLQATVEDASEMDAYYERADQVRTFDTGKRPPTSPFKNPTPKRRRTLHASELADGISEANLSYHNHMQEAISSRKREDARRGDSQDVADPDILASRKILRPRNPTPSQRRQQIRAELREAAEEFADQEPERLEAVLEHIESSIAGSMDGPPSFKQQAEALAVEVANFTLRVHKPSGEFGQRKRSITTQDFMNEAVMVMQLIRAKARPASGLGSVEESEGEGVESSLTPDHSLQDPGQSLRISRPPSREGRHSGWRSALQPQTDARVVSHLRKFQETDNTEFIAESVASLAINDEDSRADNVIVLDEASNIRISGPIAQQSRGEDSQDDSRPVSQRSEGSAYATQPSTGRTHGTSSTRKSENVGTLAPDAVAHLIGEEVGGMTFDKHQQRWVRVKSPEKQKREYLAPPSTLTSDDDPFREISDLHVDEQTELRRISSSDKTTRRASLPSEEIDFALPEQACGVPEPPERQNSAETVISRPVTRDSSHMQGRIHHAHSSSVPSRYSAFASSRTQDRVETRATSYSDEELARMSNMGKARYQPLAYAAAQATLALRGECAKVVEEPLMEESSLPTHTEEDGTEATVEAELRDDTALDGRDPSLGPIESPKLRQSIQRPFTAPAKAWQEMPARQMSLRRQTLRSKAYAQPREQSEISLIAALPGERVMSLSLSVSRPATTRHQTYEQITDLQSSPTKGDPNSTFLLSDLPDFTVHEVDEERPSEKALAQRLARHAVVQVNDRYAFAVKDLVKTLTDVQEAEPYWEDLRELDLHDRSLASLYGLGDFCTGVQRMDVSNNALMHLEGAPTTLRSLNARSNQLSSLSSWHHLMNLQYLDLSNNELTSLAGLGCLVHMRELTANDNQIVNLDGLHELDGLLKLSVRRNNIKHLDFEDTHLQRLVELDVAENNICAIQHLEQLYALQKCVLDGNMLLAGLSFNSSLAALQTLSVQRCGLARLDVTHLPQLGELYADDNSLQTIIGLNSLRHLNVLSLRRQKLPIGHSISIFDHGCEARDVRLSGNVMPSMTIMTSCLNLQHLELASVGLQDLPDDFGLRLPNLRTLNLNFNALRDIRPLLNIQKLEQLSVCGNRLDRLRKSVATLSKLPTLRSLDVRDNPVTQGFYAPVLTSHTSLVRKACRASSANHDVDDAAMEQAKHNLAQGHDEQDRQHQLRLDEETKLRRRVYELLLAHACAGLSGIDGLVFDRSALHARDTVWERLVELGVVKRSRPAALTEA